MLIPSFKRILIIKKNENNCIDSNRQLIHYRKYLESFERGHTDAFSSRIDIEGFASDGDSRYLRSQKALVGFGGEHEFHGFQDFQHAMT
jgi:hypothetical protein